MAGDETQRVRTLGSLAPPTATTEPPSAPDPGPRYVLGDVIGRGGMGEVILARDTWFDRDVAIKVLRGDRAPRELLARFRREARVQGRLEHPSIVPVHDLGTDPDGRAFFVMKRLTGATLHGILAAPAADPRWTRRTLLARLVDVCQAIAFAHERGVVHRDLQPSNIMLGDFGEVYVLDWGIAHLVGDARIDDAATPPRAEAEPDARTQTGALLGTPGYMSPEQLRGESVDGRSDVYALGLVLFEILTGEPALPHDGDAFEATLAAPAQHPRARAPEADVPPELDALCALATAPDPAERLASAELMAAGLQRYLDGERDEVQRQRLASTHVARARALLDPNSLHGSKSLRGRADAMLEAGRAFALDRTNADAQALIARLLLDPPEQIPPEVDASIAAARLETGRIQLRTAVKTDLAYFLAAPLLLLTTIAAPLVLVVIFALLLGNALLLELGARRSKPVGRLIYLALAMHCSLLAAVATLFSPFLVLPALAAISVTAFVAHPTRSQPYVVVGAHSVAVIGPLIAELVGILPRTFSISGGSLTITPWVIPMPAYHLVWIVMLFTVTAFGTAAMLVMQLRRAEESAQRDLYLNRWHLAQLVR